MDSREKYFLTLNQAADLLKLPVNDVTSLADTGKIDSHKTPGGHRRFKYLDVQNYAIENNLPANEKYEGEVCILLVDDEEPITVFIKRLIEHRYSNTKVITSANGFDAGIKAARYSPQIVIMDLMMPGMNGFDACTLLRESNAGKDMNIVILSGYANENYIARAEECGAESCISKPVMKEKIYETLDSHLDNLKLASGQ